LFLLNLTAGLPDAPGFANACGIEAYKIPIFLVIGIPAPAVMAKSSNTFT